MRVSPTTFELLPLSARRGGRVAPVRPEPIVSLRASAEDPRSAASVSLLDVLGQLRLTRSALDAVLDNLRSNLRTRVETSTLLRLAPQAAPGPGSDGGTPAQVIATRAVNATSTTTRASSSALGLAMVDRTTTLRSTSALGLDVTSPERPSAVRSSASLSLDVSSTQSPSTLSSTSEINTAPTSYSAVELAFSGTSLATITGVYAGTGVATGATSLSIRTGKGAGTVTVGATPVQIGFDILDQAGTLLASYSQLATAGQAIALGADFGLEVSFSAGTLKTNTVSSSSLVSTTTPTDVDPNAAFDASANLRPRFENGAVVSAGSFLVNGANIDVLANDTLNTVLAKINASAAGVTAAFANDKITLTSTANSEDPIVVTDDTSGFLAATKLAAANTSIGNVRDDLQVLARVEPFADVVAGSFQVDGETISVAPEVDSLQSVLAKINASGARVVASYDANAGRVVLTNTFNGEDPVSLGADTSGFLAAALLSADNTEPGNLQDDQQLLQKTTQFAAVSAGSFRVGDVTIDVDPATDSLQDVLERIQASGGGILASYDAALDKVILETALPSNTPINIGDDSTGLLALLGLDGATSDVGSVREDQLPLAQVTAFGVVSSGTLRVNGAAIDIDPTSDSILDVMQRVNAAGAGVTASYDEVLDVVRFTPDAEGDVLSLEDEGTGLLSALKIAAGTKGTALNLDGIIGSTGLDSPLFEDGVTVGAGTFSVNGVAVQVNAGESVRTVLERLGSSAAGVTASYDPGTELVTLTAKESTSGNIVLGPDSSGLLAALKLDQTATFIAGVAPSVTANETSLAFFADTVTRTSSYLFSPASVAAALEKAARSFSDVLARLSASSASSLQGALLERARSAVDAVGGAALGFRWEESSDAGRTTSVLRVDTLKLVDALRGDPAALDKLVAPDGELIAALTATVDAIDTTGELDRSATVLESVPRPLMKLSDSAAASFENIALEQALDLVAAIPVLSMRDRPSPAPAERLVVERSGASSTSSASPASSTTSNAARAATARRAYSWASSSPANGARTGTAFGAF